MLSALVLAGCASNTKISDVVSLDEQTKVSSDGKTEEFSDPTVTRTQLAQGLATYWALNGILDKPLDQLRIFQYPISLYFVYQPFAPNWSIEEARLTEDVYYIRLQAKRFRTGGDGEAMMIMKRRAAQLQRERGYIGYRLLDYSEGIESGTPISQRYSEGVFKLMRVVER